MTDRYTLYYAPGACSISPNIALREVGAPFDLVKVDLRNKTIADGDWLAINPKGYVPALRIPGGEIVTEGAIMVQYIADQFPASKLAPAWGTMERVRLNETLHFIATELHKGSSPLYDPRAGDEYKQQLKQVRLAARWTELAKQVRPYLMGERFTVADGYAFYALRSWQRTFKESLAPWPVLADYYARLCQRPSVIAALASENLEA